MDIGTITDKEAYCKPLWSRMDSDTDLLNVANRILYDTASDPKKVPNSIFVPLNDLIVFATTVESYLSDAQEQLSVTSEDKNLDTAEVESFIKAVWKAVDARWRKGIGTGGKQLTFNPFLDQQTTRRGRTSIACIFRIENDELICDMRSWDSRYSVQGFDSKGHAYSSYLTTRIPDLVAQEYPKIKLPSTNELVEVRDVWTRTDNEVWIAGQKEVYPHSYGEVPVVHEIVPIGAMTMDNNSLKYEGESIFLMLRDIFPKLEDYASIIASLNMKELDHALQEKVEKDDLTGNPPLHDQVTDPRSVTKTTGGFSPVPIGELKTQAESLHQMLETRMQRGGISNFDMGTFSQAMSAVALIRVGQGRDKVYSPRLSTRGLAKQDLTEMFIRQILAEVKRTGKRTLTIGRQTYDVSILQGQFDIEYKYSIKDATIDAARQSIASAQRGTLPARAILTGTLQREDPDGDLRQMYIEQAERDFPTIRKYRIIKALAEEAEKGDDDADIEAQMAAAELGITLDQVLAGNIPQSEPMGEVKPSQPVNIFDAGAGGVNA